MCFDSVETARLMDDCICRGGFDAVVVFAGFNFCWIQFLLDSIFAGFKFCWIQLAGFKFCCVHHCTDVKARGLFRNRMSSQRSFGYICVDELESQ